MKKITRSLISMFAIASLMLTSCKNNDKPENEGTNNAPGSFNENHTEAVDTSKTQTDSITSNSTQSDPTAS